MTDIPAATSVIGALPASLKCQVQPPCLYHQGVLDGWDAGRAAGVAAERQRILSKAHCAGQEHPGSSDDFLCVRRADLLDGGGQDGGPDVV